MTFVYEIETDFCSHPICDAMGVYIIEFSLRYHIERGEAEIMSVMLVPGASYLRSKVQNVYDLKFGIRTRCLSHTWKVGDPEFDDEATQRCVRPQDRSLVLSCVVRAVEDLIRQVRPHDLTMKTYYAGLPAKALVKFERIVQAICALGYDLVDEFIGNNGANFWHMRTRR